MKRGVVKFEVYSCYYEGKLLYVGSGAINRHKHCNSGCSHVYGLNKLHFEGAVFDIKLRYFETKEESLEVEKALIREHLPKLNSVHTSRNKSKAKWFEQYNKLREVFVENNKFDDKPSLRNKVNALFDDSMATIAGVPTETASTSVVPIPTYKSLFSTTYFVLSIPSLPNKKMLSAPLAAFFIKSSLGP